MFAIQQWRLGPGQARLGWTRPDRGAPGLAPASIVGQQTLILATQNQFLDTKNQFSDGCVALAAQSAASARSRKGKLDTIILKPVNEVSTGLPSTLTCSPTSVVGIRLRVLAALCAASATQPLQPLTND